MKTAHKIRMNPTPEQVEYLKRACGTRRFIYNWGREQWEKQYQAYTAEQEIVPEEQRVLKPPHALALKKQFNQIREQEYPWTYQVTKCVVGGAFDDLKNAYDNFFAGRANYPQYKKKGKSHESFYLSNDKFVVGTHWISIPGLGRFILDQRQTKKDRGKLLRKLGTVNLAEKLRFVEKGKATTPTKKRNKRKHVVCERVKILGATVCCEAGHWYVSIRVETTRECPNTPEPVVGVDVGVKQAAVVSDGRRLENQRPLALHLKKLGKLQRQLSKKQKTKDPQTKRTVFSKNYEKQRLKVARKHQQIANMRRDVQHKFTTELARTCGAIGIEDLNILGMMANRKLSRAVADAAMGQLLQFLKTKVANAGGELFIASRWFPSTKRCSCCGHVKKRMPLKHRTYQCQICGLVIDRDLNAALNLAWFAMEMLRQRAEPQVGRPG
ncbi:RNA-guided endonuclease InsQ/TnpB family protein [Ktedonobacter racemifer]|uniref:Transposase, IS605 OrfB family n=1 Tax=Ktedonobacter racemifer DSM 44963 TaxID=485913 RepID=D6TWB3_KTERA|nr:RNA-guided endonuclease TnpB family protein [Ktedonobacter racemifer]EFH84496.1 transposase, IS605 OrfB family [Ktedonobacter racemifer DSM 44963]